MTCRWCSSLALHGDTLCYDCGERCALVEYGSSQPISRPEAERIAHQQIQQARRLPLSA